MTGPLEGVHPLSIRRARTEGAGLARARTEKKKKIVCFLFQIMPKPVIGISPGISILKKNKMGFSVKTRKHRRHRKKKPPGIGLSGGRFKRKKRGRKRRRRRRKHRSIPELIPW
jgi:hypothetical protein